MYHTIGYRFKCKKCKKCFMFESQYDEHMSVHTRDNKYICRKKDARKIMVALMQEIITKGNMQPKQFIVIFVRILKPKNVIKSSLVNKI